MYRNDATSNSVVIGWNQGEDLYPTVFYDTVNHGYIFEDSAIAATYKFHRLYDRMVDYLGMKNCFARLNNLIPGKFYYFIIKGTGEPSKIYGFKAPSDNPEDTLVVVCGGGSRTDLPVIGELDNRDRRKYAMTMISKLKPDLVVFSGDFVLNFIIQNSLISDKQAEWQAWFDDWGKTVTQSRANGFNYLRIYPMIVAQGNHESAIDLYNLFDTPNQELYYAHSFGGNLFRLYTLNTNTAITGNQLSFLTNDLSTHQHVRWRMAHYCNPIRSVVGLYPEGDLTYDYWPPLFKQYGVQLVSEIGTNATKQTWPVIPCNSGADCDDDFIRNDTSGTVYIGEGGFGSPLAEPDNITKWMRATGELDHFNLLWISKYKIEVRAIIYGNASDPLLKPVDDTARFLLSPKLQIWENKYGKVLVIGDRYHLPEVRITSPRDSTEISRINQVIITAEASDPDGSIAKVQFYANDTLIGEDHTYPYEVSHVFPDYRTYSITALAYDNEGNNNISYPVRLFSGWSRDTVIKVVASADDAEENKTSGAMLLESPSLDFSPDTIVGMRFYRPNIPQGKEIVSSFIRFIASDMAISSSEIKIIGEYGNNARAFQNTPFNISGRIATNEVITWTPGPWHAGDTITTPDLTPIINEIVNQPGWSEYSTIGFVFKTVAGFRPVVSFDGDPLKSPCLYYEYRIPNPFLGIDENFTFNPQNLITRLYPNPAHESVEIGLMGGTDYQLKVFDHLGRTCFSIMLEDSNGKYNLNTQALIPGIYYLQVATDNKSQTEKLVIY